MIISPICSIDNVVGFFSGIYRSVFCIFVLLIRLRTLGPKKNDATLVCFSAVEDLGGVQPDKDSTGSFKQTISCIFSMANSSDHLRWVTCLVRGSPFGPEGRLSVHIVPIDGDMSTRNMVAVDLQV